MKGINSQSTVLDVGLLDVAPPGSSALAPTHRKSISASSLNVLH